MKLSPNKLGRYAAQYKRMRDAGFAEDRVAERMAEDAVVEQVETVDEWAELIKPHAEKVKGVGKREMLALKKEAIQEMHLGVCAFLNEVVLTGSTDADEFRTALQTLGAEANGWILATAVKWDKNAEAHLFTINDSGWQGRSYYADRPQPAGKKGNHKLFSPPIRATETETADAQAS